MNDAGLRKMRSDLAGLVEKKRRRELAEKPCPECGLKPRLQWVDSDTGLDTATGEPPCATCAERYDKLYPGGYSTIEFVPVNDGADYEPEDHDGAA